MSTASHAEVTQKAIRWDVGLTILLTGINIVGATAFWMSLPEKLRQTQTSLSDHELRLRTLEKLGAETSGTLARIDERTKSMSETMSEMRRDFKFNASARP